MLIRAEVFRQPDDAQPSATGHAYELRSSGQAQSTSYVEVCETSAVGRALALLGFEVKRSREEVEKATRASRPTPQKTTQQPAGLDAEILKTADSLGYDAAKVRKWVNQKFEVGHPC